MLTERMIRNRILRIYYDNLKYNHKDSFNYVCIKINRPINSMFLTLGALLGGIVLGLILSEIGNKGMIAMLDGNILVLIKTMYMNTLKLMAAPVVFFSIATCISQLGNPVDIGRIGGKILGMYMFTTVISVIVGIGVYMLFKPGNESMAAALGGSVPSAASQSFQVSIKGMIVGIVPDNILSPFLESNMLQLIFLAVLCGFAVGLIGNYSKILLELFEAFNELFIKMTGLIMHVTPLAVFCSMLSVILKIGPSSLLSLLGMIGTFLFGLFCMVIIYYMLLFLSGQNPLSFMRSYTPTMMQVFSLAASSTAIPLNMEFCKNKMGISPRIYSFSIPLGATVNMDGTCILLAVQSLTLAKIYGVDVPFNMLLPLAITIVVLSVGAPGVPGAGVIMMSMLVTQLGVPVESVGLVIGIGPLVGMFIHATNCLGDVVATTIVARSEKMISDHTPTRV